MDMNYRVTNDADDNTEGTLRTIIQSANAHPNSTITFASNITVIRLTASPLQITNTMTISASAVGVTISGCSITNILTINSVQNNPIVNLRYLTFTDSYHHLAAITINKSDVTMDHCAIMNNVSTGLMGSGIAVTDANVTLTDCNFAHNTLTSTDIVSMATGAGIYAADGSLRLTRCNLTNNTITNKKASFGGAIYSSNNVIQMDLCVFSENGSAAVTGSAIYATTDNGNITINRSSFINNNGQFSIYVDANNGLLNISNSTLVNPNASALYCRAVKLINCTVVNNESGILLYGTTNLTSTIINCTIVNNVVGLEYDQSVAAHLIPIIGNTIVAKNGVDVMGTFNSEGGNFIGLVKQAVGFNNKDQVGQTEPIDPRLNPLGNYGGPTLTLTAQFDSPILNKGLNSNLTFFLDQRGFKRIVDKTVDVGSTELQKVCLAGDSMVLVKNVHTNEISHCALQAVYASDHLVWSAISHQFVPIVYNIISGMSTQFVKVKQNSVALEVPNMDLHLTSGHVVWINGIYLKAADIPGCVPVTLTAQKIYTICTDHKNIIKIANMDVTTYGIDDWHAYSKKMGIHWINNEKQTNNDKQIISK